MHNNNNNLLPPTHTHFPYSNSLVSYYKHLSARPSQWKLVYSVSNSRAFELLADAHLKLMCERAVRKSIESYAPDVVVSVHPLMTNVPVLSCSKISQASGKHLPMFTVVTDLGSAHCLWFANTVEKMFVGSEAVWRLAQERGKVPEDKLVRTGLPIRHDFAVQAEQLGDRQSPEGIAYQAKLRKQLNLPPNKPTILLMGGGEGVGSLANITDALYAELVAQGMDAVILVVCGRNEKLQTSLAEKDWDAVLRRHRRSTLNQASCVTASPGCDDGFVTRRFRRMLTTSTLRNAIQFPSVLDDEKVDDNKAEMVEASIQVQSSIVDVTDETQPAVETNLGNVQVVGLGFVTNMAEYMVAADILVSKAGPGTISEAAALSLPVLLTSFLPGQEEGNVEYVVEHGFGEFLADTNPVGIADEICDWIKHPDALAERSRKAGAVGTPYAARDIARAIGDSTLKWMELNQESSVAGGTSASSSNSSTSSGDECSK